jgi:hypothetical protein
MRCPRAGQSELTSFGLARPLADCKPPANWAGRLAERRCPVSINLSKIIFHGDEYEPPLNEAIVQSLVERMRRGEELKPVVLVRWPDGRLGVVAGWHRLEASRRCGGKGLSAYIIDGATTPLAKLVKIRKGFRENFSEEDI